ncbi:MAG TPA: type III pantothenate kinase [Burkholderiales bacterium]|nr:type III pantothenate kinase [Burkholderiales bacterium]
MKLLAIDAGNSRIKWGVYSDGWLQISTAETTSPETLHREWSFLEGIDKIIAVNVAGPKIENIITSYLEPLRCQIDWVRSSSSLGEIKNGYLDPKKLGADRLAAMVAAWDRARKPVIVADCGTTITVDAVDGRGHFLGGVILPGKDLMKRYLAESAHNLKILPGKHILFPVTTGDAIFTGSIDALCGAIERMHKRLADVSIVTPALILGGGDADLISPYLQIEHECHEFLVLNGLVSIGDNPYA